MVVFIGFFVAIFIATAHRELRGKALRLRWVAMLCLLTTVGMLSLRVIE